MLYDVKSECSVIFNFHLNLVNIFSALYAVDTSMSKTNIDLPVRSSLGNRRIICLKHRKSVTMQSANV